MPPRGLLGRIRDALKFGGRLHQKPMHKVLKQMKRRGIDLSTLHALEVFGYTGELHTIYYAPYVSSLEIWEIDPRYEERLKRNLPRAKVRIVDSYEEIKLTPDRYDLVVVDNPMQNHGNHSEHFDLFPHIYRVCLSPTIVVLNTIPKIDDADQVDTLICSTRCTWRVAELSTGLITPRRYRCLPSQAHIDVSQQPMGFMSNGVSS